MSRGNKKIKKKMLEPDALYGNKILAKFINRVMIDGKKSIAQKQVYKAFKLISAKQKDPLSTFLEAVKNAQPQMEVRARRIGGAAYQVPVAVRPERRLSLAIRWLILEAQKKPNSEFHTFSEKLASELMDAANNTGGAIKRKETMHKMAEANRAFAHFRW